jgi:cobalt-zinc-cadmium efflux system membrane fusion protein
VYSAAGSVAVLQTGAREPIPANVARIDVESQVMGVSSFIRKQHALVLAAAWLAAGAVAAPGSAAQRAAGCLIEPSQVAEVGTPVTGVVERMQVSLGDEVQEGQPLALLRADVERANAEVADTRAQVDADVRAAEANLELAQQKVRRNRQLLEQQFVSQQALDQAQAESDVAEQKLRMARSQQAIWARERTAARAQVGLRTLRSPIAGIVVERYSNPGERVEDRPLLRVATIDPLRVDLMVPAAQWGSVALGDAITIRPDLPGAAPAHAKVSYIDRVMDAASNTFRVRLLLPNPGHRLPGGLRCKADLPGAVSAQAAPSPQSAPAAAPRAGVKPASAAPEPAAPLNLKQDASLRPRI